MTTIALIGGDGAGKTTIARAVIQNSGLPMKYLYMGFSTRSSNHALPTSRLALSIKRWIYKKEAILNHHAMKDDVPAHQLEYNNGGNRGWLYRTARFLNRTAEAWYRQFISWSYQLRGYIVIYDRHFFFDAAPVVTPSEMDTVPMLDKLYFWLISYCYPHPTMTIFLDAPPQLIFQRKGEASPTYLEQQRNVYLAQGAKLPNFFSVEASHPFEKVLEEVNELILANIDFSDYRKSLQRG